MQRRESGPPDDEDEPITPDAKPFLSHLEDLRWTIIRCLAALLVGVVICAFGVKQILNLLYRPLIAAGQEPKEFLRSLNVVDPFSIHMEIAIFGGLILALPAMLYYIGQFLLPALTPQERRFLGPIFAGGALLFRGRRELLLLPGPFEHAPVFSLLQQLSGLRHDVDGQVADRFRGADARGIRLAFEMPLVILVLNLLGLVSAAQLSSKRRHAAFIIFIVACCIIPSTDLFSLSVLSVPMYLLFELCIVIAKVVEKTKRAKE